MRCRAHSQAELVRLVSVQGPYQEHISTITVQRHIGVKLGVLIVERETKAAPDLIVNLCPGKPCIVDPRTEPVSGVVKPKTAGQRDLPPQSPFCFEKSMRHQHRRAQGRSWDQPKESAGRQDGRNRDDAVYEGLKSQIASGKIR